MYFLIFASCELLSNKMALEYLKKVNEKQTPELYNSTQLMSRIWDITLMTRKICFLEVAFQGT